jgi:hypothetical protein
MEKESPADSYLAVKAVGAGFLVLIISMLLARGIIALVVKASAPHVLWGVTIDVNRIREFKGALPEIAKRTENAAFFMGASLTFFGFSPKVFDARMREHSIDLRSYNAGVTANLPDVDALTARRIGDAYNHANRRVRLMMFAFHPGAFNGGVLSVNPYRDRGHLVKKSALLTETELVSLFLDKPHYASEILGVWLLGGFGAPDTIGLLSEQMFGGTINGTVSPSWWFGAAPPPPNPQAQATQDARRGWGPQLGHWSDSASGEFFQDQDNDEAYTRMASFAVKPPKALSEAFSGDFNILPELFAEWMEAVRDAREFSDAVVVVVMPTNPIIARDARLNATGLRHLEEVKAEIARQTGASVIDMFEPPELTPADYLDYTHLNERTGKPKFNKLLADRVAGILAHQTHQN